MPIYEYKCSECSNVFEEWIRNYDTSATQTCPKCQGQAEHIVSQTTFVLKGTGWYVTDYGNKKTTDTSGAASDKNESTGSDSESFASTSSASEGSASTNSAGESSVNTSSASTNNEKPAKSNETQKASAA